MTPSRSGILGRVVAALLALTVVGGAFVLMVRDVMPHGSPRKVEGYTPWPEDVLSTAAALPIQAGGRVKPLATHASFELLALHGARSVDILDGKGSKRRLSPVAWMLDALFRPRLAVLQPTFRIDNSDALHAIGVPAESRRDRYSYKDIQPGRTKLMELASAYSAIERESRDPVQTQIVDLADNLSIYEQLLGYFYFARNGILMKPHGAANAAGDDTPRTSMSTLLAGWDQIQPILHSGTAGQRDSAGALLAQADEAASFAMSGLAIIPPYASTDDGWFDTGSLIRTALHRGSVDLEEAAQDLAVLENLARSADTGTPVEVTAALDAVQNRFSARSSARDDTRQVPREFSHLRANWLMRGLVVLLIGTLLALATWALGRSTAGAIAAIGCLLASLTGIGLVTTAIVQRCLIMSRPPVGNLYDTIIFIGAAVPLFCIIAEVFTRRRIALGAAPILGMLLLVLARRFEVGDPTDHMNPLVAVLQSNYWLTVHVITITLGYAAGLCAAFLSTLYILVRGLGLDGGDKQLRRSFTLAVYGIVCLTLFLSLTGTVLGGIWANDSWGRFWGWDPKENGALMIVLWTLAILHARLGGYLREWGFHLATVFTAAVVTFSWWHVNFLGVGLHNYGFTAGKNTIWIFYCTVAGIILYGAIAMVVDMARSRKKPGGI